MCHRKKCCTIVLYEHEIIICVRTRQDSIEFHQNLIEIDCVCRMCQPRRNSSNSTARAKIDRWSKYRWWVNICFSKVSEFRLKYLYFCSTPQIYAPHGHITKDMSILICVINIELVLNWKERLNYINFNLQVSKIKKEI